MYGEMMREEYFKTNAKDWMEGAYEGKRNLYPVGVHRLRIAKDIITEYADGKTLKILDVGCGGGKLCVELAKRGHTVHGIDQSYQMLTLSRQLIHEQLGKSNNIKLSYGNFESRTFKKNHYDVIVALGVIGYIKDKKSLFTLAKQSLKPGGLLIISCRNRLFNMFPTSIYIEDEISGGNANHLIREIRNIYSLYTKKPFPKKPKESPSQQTPDEMIALGKENGLETLSFRGVHPHFFTKELSARLLEYEDSPLSLIWSSVFIVTLKKTTDGLITKRKQGGGSCHESHLHN